MTQIGLLKAATPGVWRTMYGHSDWGMPCSHSVTCLNDAGDLLEVASVQSVTPYCIGASQSDLKVARESQADAELLCQAKVNALLVECVVRGWVLLIGNGHSSIQNEEMFGKYHPWVGLPHEMDEETFQQVLAELEGANAANQ